MLSAIGEAPVAALDETFADAELAFSILRRVAKAVQTEGWHFNTVAEQRLTPNSEGEIELPAHTLYVDPSGPSAHMDLVYRDGKLFDREEQTFEIGQEVTVKLAIELPFANIPEVARQYIQARAGRVFTARTLGRQDLVGYTRDDEAHARANLEVEDASVADASLLQNPHYWPLFHRRGVYPE